MTKDRKTAAIIGALFLTVMVTWSIGYWLIGEVLDTPEYLSNASPKRNLIFLGVLIELIEIGAILGIVVAIFPLMRQYNERMALWYFGFRIMECFMLVIAAISALAVITLSKNYLNTDGSETANLQALGDLCISIRNKWVHVILPFFYSSAGVVFFYYFYKDRLIPRAISVIGIIGAALVMIGIPLDFLEFKPGAFIGAMMGLTEIFLGIWLLVKGFSSPVKSHTGSKHPGD